MLDGQNVTAGFRFGVVGSKRRKGTRVKITLCLCAFVAGAFLLLAFSIQLKQNGFMAETVGSAHASAAARL